MMGPRGAAAAEKAKRVRCSGVPVFKSCSDHTIDILLNLSPGEKRRVSGVETRAAGLNYPSIRGDETRCNLWLIAKGRPL